MTSEQAFGILCQRFPEHCIGAIVEYCADTTEWNCWDEVTTEELLVEDYLLYKGVLEAL